MKNYILLVCIFIISFGYSQTTLSGTVKGSDSLFLENVNVLAFPINKDVNMSFATTKPNGNYEVTLQKNETYKITLSHIGYVTLNDTISANQNTINKDFTLELDQNVLTEVVLEYTPDVKVRKDTITYKVDAFVNGNERKLREVLKKLPGVTVDRDGNVESQGKKVTTVLVEDKKFFNGKTKMAVNNIPADVIKEVEIIDDYHETAFMKGLENSEEIALNINLKDDKKNFIFGDLEAGIGVKNRYKVHPSLFKYGTKATYNIIGDLNNTDEKSFTIRDLLDFEGGQSVENFSQVFNSGLAQFLSAKDFKANTHKFGALNFQFNPNTKNEFRFYGIGIKDKSLYESQFTNNYIEDNSTEIRSTNTTDAINALFTKFHYKFTGENNTEFKIEGGLDVSDLNSELKNNSQFTNNTFNYTTNNDNKESKTSLKLDYKNKINRYNTFTLSTNYQNNVRDNNINWLSEDNLFNTNIPIQTSLFYNIVNPNEYLDNTVNSSGKYYWIVNRKTHLNFGLQYQFLNSDFNYRNFQILNNNTQNNFNQFQNKTNNTLNTYGFYIQLKKIYGDFLIETKITAQQNNWSSKQRTVDFENSKAFLLPEAIITWEPTTKKELRIRYKKESSFFNFNNSILSNQIRSFNSIFFGNSNLPIGTYDVFSINFKNYKTYSISYYPSFTYRKRVKEVISKTTLNGIYTVNTPTVLNAPNENYNFRFRTKYNRKYFNIGLTPSYDIYNFKSIVNETTISNKNRTFSTNLDFETHFEENVNYDFSISYNNRINTSSNLKSIVNSTNIYLGLSYELEKWTFKTNGSQTYFKSKNSINRKNSFNTVDFSILYHKEDNPWSFELKAKNIFNNRSNISSSFNGLFLAQEETFVFPRYALLNIYYKL